MKIPRIEIYDVSIPKYYLDIIFRFQFSNKSKRSVAASFLIFYGELTIELHFYHKIFLFEPSRSALLELTVVQRGGDYLD